jgi:hypothetical protein
MPSPPGPPPIVPSAAFTVLLVSAVLVAPITRRPSVPAAEVLNYTQEHAGSLRLGAFLSLGAAVPLAVFAATAYRRLRALGGNAAGSAIALSGGLLAAGFLALSGLVGWTASRADGDAALASVLRDLAFATGGPGFVAFFGLLLAGIAVPMLLLGIHRPVAVAGLVLAVIAELSTLTMLADVAALTMPVARLGGTGWILLVSVLLPASRPRGAKAERQAAR